MRVLRFMQLPLVVALLVNLVLVARLPVAQVNAGGKPVEALCQAVRVPEAKAEQEETPACQLPPIDPAVDGSSSEDSQKRGQEDGVAPRSERPAESGDALLQPQPSPPLQQGALSPYPLSGPVAQGQAAERPQQVADSESPLVLLFPAIYEGEIQYIIDGEKRVLRPGQSDRRNGRQAWKIQFHRGGLFGNFNNLLAAGTYRFTAGPRGWELVPVETGQSLQP